MELGENEPQVCRLCGQCENIFIDIFGDEGKKRHLSLKIYKKINIVIDEEDPLPKVICVQCLGKLEFVCDFQEECLRTQQAFRDHYNLPSLTEIVDVKNEDKPSTSANNNNNEINKNLNSPNERRAKEPTTTTTTTTEPVPKATAKNQRTLRSQNQTKESEEPAKQHESVIQHTSEAKCENPQTVEQNSEATTPRWLRSRQNTEASEATTDTPIANRLRSHNSTAIEINENGDKDPHIIQIPTSALNKLLSIVSNSPNIDVCVKESRNQGIDNEDISFTVELCKNESKDVAVVRARVFPDQGSCLVDKDIVDLLQNQNSAEINGIINTIINSSVKNGSSIKSKDAGEFEQKWQASQNPEELFRIDGEEIRVDDNVEHIVTNNQNSYSCKLCCKVYERKDKCMVHVKTHLGIKQYACILCSAKFVCKSDVMKHIRCSHTNPRPIQCPKCPKRFKSKFYLTEHDNVHKGVRPYACTDCGQSYHHKVSLQIHMKSHLPPQNLACEYCGKVFPYRTRLLSHIASVHLKNRRNFRCRFCYNLYSSLSVLNEHIKMRHATTYTCEVCNKTFKVTSKYKAHLMQHSNPKPFVCNICNNRYASKAFLNEHLLKHEGLRKHICQKCGARFAQASHLAAHRHVHGEKEHACPECGRKFNRRDNMKVEQNDRLPQHVCRKCFLTLKFYENFYDECHRTQKNLPQALESDKENVAPPTKRRVNALPSGKTDTNCADTEDLSKNGEKKLNNLITAKSLAEKIDAAPQQMAVRPPLRDTKSLENIETNLKASVQRNRDSKSDLEKTREVGWLAGPTRSQLHRDLSDKYYNRVHKNVCTNKSNCATNNVVISSEPRVKAEKQITAVDTLSKREDETDDTIANCLRKSRSAKTENTVDCVKNVEKKCSKSDKAVLGIVKREKGDEDIDNLTKINKHEVQTITPLTEETVRPESNETDLASKHDLITSAKREILITRLINRTTDSSNKKVFIGEQEPVSVIECSRSKEILRPDVTQENSVNTITQSSKSDLDGSLTDDSSSQKSSRGSIRESPNCYNSRKLSELMSEEQKRSIDSSFIVNMSVVDKEEVERNMTVHGKCTKCKICDASYARTDKCQVHVWGHLQMKPYQCRKCDFATVTISNVRCHIRKRHFKIKPFACQSCGKTFATGVLLAEHQNSHTGARPYKCNICSFTCAHRHTLAYHNDTHKTVKDFKCDICNKEFCSKSRLRNHTSVHKRSKNLMCKLCSVYLSSSEKLEAHRKNVHSQTYSCTTCGKSGIKSKKALHNHQKVHDDPKYQCTLCPKVYKSRQILQEHILKHNGIRKYKCEHCDKDYAQSSHLGAHKSKHNDKRFLCPGCGKEFNRKDNMKVHTKRCASFRETSESNNFVCDDRTS